ncbi:MAG: hypothetical protein AB7I37_03390 [Pirellulales bacterium]
MLQHKWLPLVLLAGLAGPMSWAAEPKSLLPQAADPGDVAEAGLFADRPNLIANGDFEEGEDGPAHWQTIDGLSSFWVDDPEGKRGKVLKLDTDVAQKQAYDWWTRLVKEDVTAKAAPSKQPTVEPKYDTLAGLDGVWFWSDPVEIKKGKQYWLTVDVKGPGMKVFMRGYPNPPDTAFGADEGAFMQHLQKLAGEFRNERGRKAFIKKYTWDSWMKAGGGDQWQTYSRREKPFAPTKHTPNVKHLRVMLYPYWPPGVYYIDNVRLVEYDAPEVIKSE